MRVGYAAPHRQGRSARCEDARHDSPAGLSLLQDEDQMLASAIVSSREAIWRLLADPKTFANLQN